MKSRMAAVLAVACLPAVADCGSLWPAWSEVTGIRYKNTIAERWPARIVSVGGQLLLVLPYRVQPGTQRVVVESPRHDGYPGTLQAFEITLEPCIRYYINAQFDAPTGQGWRPVIDTTEIIPGCPMPSL